MKCPKIGYFHSILKQGLDKYGQISNVNEDDLKFICNSENKQYFYDFLLLAYHLFETLAKKIYRTYMYVRWVPLINKCKLIWDFLFIRYIEVFRSSMMDAQKSQMMGGPRGGGAGGRGGGYGGGMMRGGGGRPGPYDRMGGPRGGPSGRGYGNYGPGAGGGMGSRNFKSKKKFLLLFYF